MSREDLQPFRYNLKLKNAYEKLGLDPTPVIPSTPLELDLENRRLESLLAFTLTYKKLGGRENMLLVKGECTWPPIHPGIDPESDWYRFERWVQGKSVSEPIINQMPLHEKLRPAEEIPDAEIEAETERLIDLIRESGNDVYLQEGVPARLVYKNLMEWINEDHELNGPFGGCWTYDGCSGYCPGCFQRPWCETGNSSCWREDEEIGKIYYIDDLKPFVSASPQSFDIISKLQAEEDASFAKWKEEKYGERDQEPPFYDDFGLRSFGKEGELPF